MNEFARLLQALMAERGISGLKLARLAFCDKGHISRLRNGHTRPSPTMAAKLDEILGAGGRLIALAGNDVAQANRREVLMAGLAASAITPQALHRVLGEAAAEAMELTRLAAASAVGKGVFDHLDAVITRIDRAYHTEPPGSLFPLARAYRNRVGQLSHGTCTLREKRDLYVAAAWLSELLGWLAYDLGHLAAAEAYAIDCYEHADQAGHDELCAWAANLLSETALHSTRPQQAVAAARKGIARAPAGHPLAVRLRTRAARAHARLGQRDECESVLAEAERLYESLPSPAPTRFGSDTKMPSRWAVTAHPSQCYIWLEDFAKAESYGRRALALDKSAPTEDRLMPDLARFDLGIALAGLGRPDEAAEQGLQALSAPRVVQRLTSQAARLDTVLSERYPGTAAARGFRARYGEYARTANTGGPPH